MFHTRGVTSDVITLVPPRRLGVLLASARQAAHLQLGDVARASRFDVAELAAIEAGERVLDDAEITEVSALYGVVHGTLVPERAQLVIDLDEHTLAVGGVRRRLAGDAPTADEVMASYLSLVYTMRNAVAGTPLVLRDVDVDVLARVLRMAQPDVQRRLQELMAEPAGAVSAGVRSLRHRLLLPVAGVIVAATAVGTLLLVQAANDSSPPQPVITGSVDIGTAVVQTRLPDGTPGPVVPVTLEAQEATSTTEATGGPDASVEATGEAVAAEVPVQLGPAQTLEGGPDGFGVIYAEGPIDLAPNQVQLGEAQTLTS